MDAMAQLREVPRTPRLDDADADDAVCDSFRDAADLIGKRWNAMIVHVPGLDNTSAFAKTGAVGLADMARAFAKRQPIVVIDERTGARQLIWSELDVNASVVWWLWGDGTSAPKGLFRAKADGTGWTAVDTGSDFSWFGPRVDDTAVYYFHAGALLKRLK